MMKQKYYFSRVYDPVKKEFYSVKVPMPEYEIDYSGAIIKALPVFAFLAACIIPVIH